MGQKDRLHNTTIAAARRELRANQSLYDMLKKGTPLEDLAAIRDAWITPLEERIQELEKKQREEEEGRVPGSSASP